MSAKTQTVSHLIDHRTTSGPYDMPTTEAIVEHPKHGRIYIAEGFGGVDSLGGGAVRWRHGTIHQLREGDTFATLDAEHPDYIDLSPLDLMREDRDQARPMKLWTGDRIRAIALSVGLA